MYSVLYAATNTAAWSRQRSTVRIRPEIGNSVEDTGHGKGGGEAAQSPSVADNSIFTIDDAGDVDFWEDGGDERPV